MGRTRSIRHPWQVWQRGLSEWRVLRHYQSPEAEADNPWARVYCFVRSPLCPEGEYAAVFLWLDIVADEAELVLDDDPAKRVYSAA
jgi:hypothetical protein